MATDAEIAASLAREANLRRNLAASKANPNNTIPKVKPGAPPRPAPRPEVKDGIPFKHAFNPSAKLDPSQVIDRRGHDDSGGWQHDRVRNKWVNTKTGETKPYGHSGLNAASTAKKMINGTSK